MTLYCLTGQKRLSAIVVLEEKPETCVHWDSVLTCKSSSAWWIAFGPHGPRAESPPGEWASIFAYTAIGIGVSVVLFWIIHAFARPPPRTMTKEWQEATNEYLKVRRQLTGDLVLLEVMAIWTDCLVFLVCRKRDPTPSTVLAAKATPGKVLYRASRRRSIDDGPLRLLLQQGRGWEEYSLIWLAGKNERDEQSPGDCVVLASSTATIRSARYIHPVLRCESVRELQQLSQYYTSRNHGVVRLACEDATATYLCAATFLILQVSHILLCARPFCCH